MKKSVVFLLSVLAFISISFAEDNTFLDRSYWKSNPSIADINQKIDEGHDVTDMNEYAFDAVCYALIEKVDNNTIKHLLSFEGNGANKLTHDGRTYVFWAAYRSNLEIMKYLLSKGAKTNIIDSHGYSLLNFSGVTGQIDKRIYQFCLENGSNLSEKNNDGANCLLLIIPFITDFTLIDFFIENGASYKDTDRYGNGLFNYGSKRGNIDLLNYLARKGVDTNVTDTEGENALFKAAYGTRGHSNTIEIFEYLTVLGTDIKAVNIHGKNILHISSSSNEHIEVIEYLLKLGLDPHLKDIKGNTAFHLASSGNSLEIVTHLYNHAKNSFQANENGHNPLDLAVAKNSPEVVKFLVSNYVLQSSEKTYSPEIAHLLISQYRESKANEFYKKLEILKSMDVDFNIRNQKGQTIIHAAVLKNNLDLIKAMEQLGVDINAADNEGLTSLHLASMKAHNIEVLKLLTELGADTSLKTSFGESTLELAMENELLPYSKTLVKLLK